MQKKLKKSYYGTTNLRKRAKTRVWVVTDIQNFALRAHCVGTACALRAWHSLNMGSTVLLGQLVAPPSRVTKHTTPTLQATAHCALVLMAPLWSLSKENQRNKKWPYSLDTSQKKLHFALLCAVVVRELVSIIPCP